MRRLTWVLLLCIYIGVLLHGAPAGQCLIVSLDVPMPGAAEAFRTALSTNTHKQTGTPTHFAWCLTEPLTGPWCSHASPTSHAASMQSALNGECPVRSARSYTASVIDEGGKRRRYAACTAGHSHVPPRLLYCLRLCTDKHRDMLLVALVHAHGASRGQKQHWCVNASGRAARNSSHAHAWLPLIQARCHTLMRNPHHIMYSMTVWRPSNDSARSWLEQPLKL